jgi:hypothetical protein
MLIKNPSGHYSFIQGIEPYSAGAVAEPGYEIEHARFSRPLPLKQGLDRVRAHLGSLGRPTAALCGMELRSSRPYSFQGFAEFNGGYVEVLRRWNLLVNGANPVARTNVSPELIPPSEPCVHGFSYTTQSQRSERTFIVAGGGELPEGSLDPHDVVRRGETSPAAIREKVQFVMKLMEGRLKELGVSWAQATAINIYSIHPLGHCFVEDILKPLGTGMLVGVTLFQARPPIVSIEYEMDIRGCRREILLPV